MEVLYHLFFIGSIGIPIILIIVLIFRNRSKEVIKKKYNAKTVFQMAIQYVIAYNLIFFIQELFLAWGKNWIGLTSYLYHNNHGWVGDDHREALLQGSGAIAIFIIGLLMVGIYLVLRKRALNIWTKTMILWLALHGLMQSLPQITTAFVAKNTDVGQAFDYLNVDGLTGFAIALLSVLCTIYASKWFFEQFAELGLFSTANSRSQFKSMLKIIFLPVFIASFLIILYRIFPLDRGFNQFFNLIPWLTWFFVFAIRSVQHGTSRTLESRGLILYTLFALGILVFFQAVLAQGVVFVP